MTPDALCFVSATELAALIRRRKVSPLEVTRAVLDRIARVNPTLNAYCTVASDQGPDAHQGHPHDVGLDDLSTPTASPTRTG